MDTQRLIVRRYTPGRALALWSAAAVAALLLVLIAFEAGRMRAGYSVVAAERTRFEQAAEIRELRGQLKDAEARLAAAEIARRVDRESSTQVEKSIGDLEARVAEQSQELTFYRGIVNPGENIEGLRIGRVKVLPGVAPHRYRVRIVLLQAARQDGTTSAAADLSIDATRGGRPVNLPFAEIATSGKPLSFSFRYFQEVETEIQLPADVTPQRVQVEVRPARATAPLRQTVAWKIDTT